MASTAATECPHSGLALLESRFFHIWAIGYGTNDAWQKVAPEIFEQQMQTIVDRIQAAGRIPVLARMPFASKGPADSDVQAPERRHR